MFSAASSSFPLASPLPQVFLGLLYGCMPVAVKVLLIPPGGALPDGKLQREVAMLHRCRHPGILQASKVACLQAAFHAGCCVGG